MLAENLTTEDVAIANEITRNALILTDGASPEKAAEIATYAIGQLIGVTMALGSAPRRMLDSERLNYRTGSQFQQVKARAQVHAMDEIINGASVEEVILGWSNTHIVGRAIPHRGRIEWMPAPLAQPELTLPPPPVPGEPLPIHLAVLAVIARHRCTFGVGPSLKAIANACRWRRADDAAPVLEDMRKRALIEWDGEDWGSLRITSHGASRFG